MADTAATFQAHEIGAAPKAKLNARLALITDRRRSSVQVILRQRRTDQPNFSAVAS